MKWRIAPGQTLRHHSWGQEAVLYNDLSGDTHLLTVEAISLLVALRDNDVSDAEIDDPELAPLLRHLAELYLLSSCPPSPR